MKLYTSYFRITDNIDTSLVQISIANKSPRGFRGYFMKRLAPDMGHLNKYRSTNDREAFEEAYKKKLADMSVASVISEIRYLSEGRDAVLMCWERPEKFCHRQLVAEWLKKNSNIEIEEYKVKDFQDGLFV
jgi:uncharacterized protein (DUF488 family)